MIYEFHGKKYVPIRREFSTLYISTGYPDKINFPEIMEKGMLLGFGFDQDYTVDGRCCIDFNGKYSPIDGGPLIGGNKGIRTLSPQYFKLSDPIFVDIGELVSLNLPSDKNFGLRIEFYYLKELSKFPKFRQKQELLFYRDKIKINTPFGDRLFEVDEVCFVPITLDQDNTIYNLNIPQDKVAVIKGYSAMLSTTADNPGISFTIQLPEKKYNVFSSWPKATPPTSPSDLYHYIGGSDKTGGIYISTRPTDGTPVPYVGAWSELPLSPITEGARIPIVANVLDQNLTTWKIEITLQIVFYRKVKR